MSAVCIVEVSFIYVDTEVAGEIYRQYEEINQDLMLKLEGKRRMKHFKESLK